MPQGRTFLPYDYFEGRAAPAGTSLGPATRSTVAAAAVACSTDDRGPLSPPCPAPGSGSTTYVYDEHIPRDAGGPVDQVLDSMGTPFSSSHSPCPGAAYTKLPSQDNAPPMPGESIPSGDRNYRVQFTIDNPAGGPPGGATPMIDVRVSFDHAVAPDPTTRVSTVELAVVRLAGGAIATRVSCAWLSGLRPTFRLIPAVRRRCVNPIWVRARLGPPSASGIRSWSLRLRGRLPRGRYVAYSRATTASGVRQSRFTLAAGNRRPFAIP